MKFAHMGDCHLGGWRQPELNELNREAFLQAIMKCIVEKVEFVLISGDLFDAAYPPIETLKDTFAALRKLKEVKIPVFMIAGSHDYSASGKSFLEVLDRAGLAKLVDRSEEKEGALYLLPTIYGNVALYGFSGKKSGLEVADIERMKLHDAPGMYRILLLHTAIRDAVGSLPIPAVDEKKLPPVDYCALSHLHIEYNKDKRVYSGPLFPNNIQELEELRAGTFYIVENGIPRKQTIKLKEVITCTATITNAFNATEEIINELETLPLRDAILILRVQGTLQQGKANDINFQKIEEQAKRKGAYMVLKSISALYAAEYSLTIKPAESEDLEHAIIADFEKKYPSPFNEHNHVLIKTLQIEKGEEEKTAVFDERLYTEFKKVLRL